MPSEHHKLYQGYGVGVGGLIVIVCISKHLCLSGSYYHVHAEVVVHW